jgi:hypothetical protein
VATLAGASGESALVENDELFVELVLIAGVDSMIRIGSSVARPERVENDGANSLSFTAPVEVALVSPARAGIDVELVPGITTIGGAFAGRVGVAGGGW